MTFTYEEPVSLRLPSQLNVQPLTNSQERPKIEYSKQGLITLRHRHENLTGLSAGTISTIRRLQLNRKN